LVSLFIKCCVKIVKKKSTIKMPCTEELGGYTPNEEDFLVRPCVGISEMGEGIQGISVGKIFLNKGRAANKGDIP
jgi:hypothetical protein